MACPELVFFHLSCCGLKIGKIELTATDELTKCVEF